MYHLVNRHGNVHKLTESARKRDELLAEGYTEVAPPETASKPPRKAKAGEKAAGKE